MKFLLSKSILIFITFSLVSSLSLSEQIPLKESFTPLNSHETTLFELPASKELYFSFDNQYDNSDIVINLQNAKQYTTHAYIYDDVPKIKKDNNGLYVDYVEDLDLSEKNFILKSSEISIKKTKYYIIIKDLLNYSTKDYITIFNEQDVIDFSKNPVFITNYYYSKNQFSFVFDAQKDEEIILEFNINNPDFTQKITVKLNDEELYNGVRNQGFVKLNENKNLEGTYKIYLSSVGEDLYTFIKSSMILRKQKYKVLELKPSTEQKLVFSQSNTFSFFTDIDEYDYNEENILTFKFSHNVSKNQLIDFCYVKTMNFDEYDDDKFYANMPTHEEENEGDFSRLNTIDNIYHLYFKKTKEKEEGKKSYLMVYCSFTIDEEMDYLYPEYFSVFLSERAGYYDLTQEQFQEKVNVNLNVDLKDFVPQVYRIKIPPTPEDDYRKYSYVFYTNYNLQTVYENSMIGSDHKNEVPRNIYSIPYEKTDLGDFVYIKIFGGSQKVNFRIESTKSQIYYYNSETRTRKTIGKEHLNCGESFYYIGSYTDLATETHFYLEEIYGQYTIYSKNEITNDDKDTILTNLDQKYLVNSKVGLLSNTFDILELKCTSPGYFNLHILSETMTKSLTMYSRNVGYVPKGTVYFYPNALSQYQNNINLEFSNPLGKDLNLSFCLSDNVTCSNENNLKGSYLQYKYATGADLPYSVKLIVNEDTIISVRLTDDSLYKVVDTEHNYINEQRILFKFNNSQDYKNTNITIRRAYHDYAYTLFKGDISFATDPIYSNYDYVSIGRGIRVDLMFSNPYNKPYSMKPDKEDSPFYLMFYIYDPEGIQKDVYMKNNPIETYEKMPLSVTKIFKNSNEKYSLDISKDVSIASVIYQSCGNSFKKINIYSYDDVLNVFDTTNDKTKFYLGKFNNYLVPSQIGGAVINESLPYSGVVVGVSTSDIEQKYVDDLNNLVNNVTQNGKKLKWNKLDNVVNYEVYVFDENNKDVEYIKNPCYLESLKSDKNNLTYIKHYSTKDNYYTLTEEGIYIVTVMASLEGKTPLNYVYNELRFNSSSPPYDEDEGGVSTALIVVLSIIGVIIIAVIIVLVIVLLKKRKSIRLSAVDEKTLVRDTVASDAENQ